MDLGADYLLFDGLETVDFIQPRAGVNHSRSGIRAKRFAIEQSVLDGTVGLEGAQLEFRLSQAEVGTDPKQGDVLIDTVGQRWAILAVRIVPMIKMYCCYVRLQP